MPLQKVVILLCIFIGASYPIFFVIAALIYLLVVRNGADIFGYWLFRDKDDKW